MRVDRLFCRAGDDQEAAVLVDEFVEIDKHCDLVELVWRDGYRGTEEVKLYVSYLRRKFRVAGLNPIETLRGFGYRYRPQPLAEGSGDG